MYIYAQLNTILVAALMEYKERVCTKVVGKKSGRRYFMHKADHSYRQVSNN